MCYDMCSSMITPLLETLTKITPNLFAFASQSSSTHISSLPSEIMVKIFANLDEKSLVNTQGTCHNFNNIIQTHRYRMKPCNIGTLDVVLKDGEKIEYIKHSKISSGIIQIDRPLKYKGTTFKLENAMITNLNIILHHFNESTFSSLNLTKIQAKKITVKFICQKSDDIESAMERLSANLSINQCHPKLQICFMQDPSVNALSIVKCYSSDKLTLL